MAKNYVKYHKNSESGPNKKLRNRTVVLILFILVVGFGAIICRLAYLQIFQSTYLQEKAVEQQLTDTTLTAKRGTIYDTNGKILAQSASVWQVVLAPAYFETEEQRVDVAKELARILELDETNVYEKTQKDSYYVVVKRKIESDKREEIIKLQDYIEEEYQLSNVVQLLDDYKRYYPYNDLASSVIGFTGSEDQGLEGVEYEYDSYLTGTPGRIVTAQNANGTDMPFQYEQNVEAQEGHSIYLTIDETIQAICEKYMKQGIQDNAVINRGVCIAMDVDTGAILSMVTVGGYDLNKPYELPAETQKKIDALPEDKQDAATGEALSQMWRNKAISDTYYPGSVFKVITAAMALNEGVVDESTTFHCTGSMTIADAKPIHCHNLSGCGTQTFQQAITNSCNPAFIQIGQKIGAENYWEYYQGFGFNETTGIDLPGESNGLFFSKDGKMTTVDLAVSSFGQGISITPIQMITSVAAVANGGYLVQPYVVRQIVNSEGNVVQNTENKIKRQVISEEVSNQMNEILEANTITGGANSGYIAGYRVAGKTGTSEKLTETNGNKDYIASFCGYAPADDPKIAMLVFFDTPTGDSYYGSQVSSPVFINIMSEVLPYLQVQAEYTDDEKKYVDTTAGAYVGLSVEEAKAQAEEAGFTTTVKGEGETVVSQIPGVSSRIPKGGNIVLYTDAKSEKETVTVPNMVGFSVSDVNYVASNAGINASISNAASSDVISISQSIEAGTEVSPGTVVTVKFATSQTVND